MGTVPPCHGVARRGSFIWVMIPVPSMGSVCEVCVRGATVTLHDAPVDILFRCLEVLCHLLFPLCHRNGHRDVLPPGMPAIDVDGGDTDVSPISARAAVAAGVLATRSLRSGSVPFDVPELDAELADYFHRGQHNPHTPTESS